MAEKVGEITTEVRALWAEEWVRLEVMVLLFLVVVAEVGLTEPLALEEKVVTVASLQAAEVAALAEPARGLGALVELAEEANYVFGGSSNARTRY